MESNRGKRCLSDLQVLDEEPVVFLDIVKVIPPDDGGPVHLQLGHHTGEDTATDGHLEDMDYLPGKSTLCYIFNLNVHPKKPS